MALRHENHTARSDPALLVRRIVLVAGLSMGICAGIAIGQEAERDQPPAPAASGSGVADADALDRLRLAASALREATTVSFRLKTSATGLLTNGTPVVDYTIKMQRPSGQTTGWTIRVSGQGRRRPAEEQQEISAILAAEQVTWLDHALKQLVTKPIRNARGQSLQLIYAARVPELMGDDPLGKESNAAEATIEGSADVDGVTCDIVSVRVRPKSARTKWWIARTDNLPRRVEKTVESATMGGSSTTEFLEMRTGVELAPADMEIPLPDGYTRVGGAMPPHAVDATLNPQPVTTSPETPASPGDESEPSASGVETVRPATDAGSPAAMGPNLRTSPPPPPVDDGPVDLKLTTEDGTVVQLSSLRGKPAILFFMGTWSLPSRSAIPELEHQRTAFGDEVAVLALAVRERYPERVGEFVRSLGAALRVIPRGDEAARELDIRVVPAIVVLDAQGVVKKRIQGVKKADLEGLRELLGNNPSPTSTNNGVREESGGVQSDPR